VQISACQLLQAFDYTGIDLAAFADVIDIKPVEQIEAPGEQFLVRLCIHLAA
jgi:hypothetical protein